MNLTFLVLALALVALLGGGVALLTLVYRVPRVPHQRTPADFGVEFEEVRIPTANRRTLYGWRIAARAQAGATPPTLVLVHGWGRNLGRMLSYIRNLNGRGFELLAFDARHHGSSDSDGHSSQLKFAQDILAVVEWESSLKGPDAAIGVLGLSIGGAAALFAAAREPRILAVVTVGAPSHPAAVMRHEFRKRRIPYFPLVWLLFRLFEHRLGMTLDELAAVNNLARVESPVLLVHGRLDEVVPLEQGESLKRAADATRTRLWVMDGRGHSDCHREDGFWEEIGAFFSKALRVSAAP